MVASQETTIFILAAVGIVLVLIVIAAIYYKFHQHQVYELYEHDNVLAVRRKSVSIMPANGDGTVSNGFVASQARHQTERERANDFRLRAKTQVMHKDSINHKAQFRVSQKKAGGTVEDPLDDEDLDAVPKETSVSINNALDIETGDAKQEMGETI